MNDSRGKIIKSTLAMHARRLALAVFAGVLIMTLFSCAGFRPFQVPEHPDTQSVLQGQIQNLLDEAINTWKLPGAQAGIRFPDGRLLLVSSGTREYRRESQPITTDTMFRVGSTTKMFTAALVVGLAERGVLDLDAPAETWFPGKKWARTVTVRSLLNHTSGISESLFLHPGILMGSAFDPAKRWDPEEVVEMIMKDANPPPPQERAFLYSNNNYLILGLIAEKCAQKPLAVQFEQEFFTPLGMVNTRLLPVPKGSVPFPGPGYDEYLPFGPHKLDGNTVVWDSLTFSAGAVASTATDLLIWLDALFTEKVLKPESFAALRQWVDARHNGRDDSIVAYGLGLARYEIDGIFMEGHPGGGFGGECFPFHVPETGMDIVVCINVSRKDNPAGKALIRQVLDLVARN